MSYLIYRDNDYNVNYLSSHYRREIKQSDLTRSENIYEIYFPEKLIYMKL